MRLSFEDEESFREAVESLRFNNPPSDSNTHQQTGNGGSIPLQDSERNEDDITSLPSDPDILRRVGSTRSSTILPSQERSGPGDFQVYLNSSPRNPEYTTANGK